MLLSEPRPPVVIDGTFYGDALTGAFRDSFMRSMGLPVRKLISLHEEVVLAKHTVKVCVRLYNAACMASETTGNTAAIDKASMVLNSALAQVSDLVQAAAKVHNMMNSGYGMGMGHISVVEMLSQVTRVLHKEMTPEEAARLTAALRADPEVAAATQGGNAASGGVGNGGTLSSEPIGTNITPSMSGRLLREDVLAMDESIPHKRNQQNRNRG